MQDTITATAAVWLLTYRLKVPAVGESLSKQLLKGGGLLNGKQQKLYLKVICTLSHQVGETAPMLQERKKIKVSCKTICKETDGYNIGMAHPCHGRLATQGTEHRKSIVPCVIAELYTDSLRDAPVRRKDAETLFLIVDQGTSQPGISSVHFVQPGNVQTLMEHYLIV